MSFRVTQVFRAVIVLIGTSTICLQIAASCQTSTSSTSSSKAYNSQTHPAEPTLDPGTVSGGVYRNSGFAFTCKIPAGWVLRTEKINAPGAESDKGGADRTAVDSGKGGRVLLASFSRPPEARAEDVNASILIAVESAAAYPGLKDAAQYFGPLTEVAKAQGFKTNDETYEFVSGAKTLVRGDFQKDVGTRVMRQSTLVMLARGYAISFTFIGGTEDEVEELMKGLAFGTSAKTGK